MEKEFTFVHAGIPAAAQQLLWAVFFVSRNRGVNLETHFPWIHETTGTTCITLNRNTDLSFESTMASLVIRDTTIAAVGQIGMLGLVCVKEEHRGQGLSSRLLFEAIRVSKSKRLDSLVLWTNKPEVYAKLGFVVDSSDKYGEVYKPHKKLTVSAVVYSKSMGRGGARNTACGIPAFANEIFTLKTPKASLTALRVPNGISVTEWHGDWDSIFELIENALPETWMINAAETSEIFDEFDKRSYCYKVNISSLRMSKKLSKNYLPLIPYIPLLDRI